jgi:hypothetical protein
VGDEKVTALRPAVLPPDPEVVADNDVSVVENAAANQLGACAATATATAILSTSDSIGGAGTL